MRDFPGFDAGADGRHDPRPENQPESGSEPRQAGDATPPFDPAELADTVAKRITELDPAAALCRSGDRELIVNGRRLDLENLARMIAHEPGRADHIVAHFVEHMFGPEAAEAAAMPFDFARTRIMPRIQPESIFEHLNRELVAHVPYVNGTVVVFVTDLPNMTVSITTEQCVRWGVHPEDLEEIARQNLDRYAPELSIQIVESKEGGRAAIVSEQDGYDAARLLMTSLFDRLRPEMGGDFYVATPARDMFVAMSLGPGAFLQRLQQRVRHDYGRLPYPITDQLFYVTRDGVAGTAEAAA